MAPLPTVNSEPTHLEIACFFSGRLRESIESLPPELVNITQEDLEKQRKPTETDFFLRESFWNAIENAKKTGQPAMMASAVYGPVCSSQAFDRVMASSLRVAWLLTKPKDDKERMRYGLSLGLSNLIEFVSKPPTVDTASAFLKAMEILINRVHGPMIQRIEAKHAHLNLNKPVTALPDAQRLTELKEKITKTRDVSEPDNKG